MPINIQTLIPLFASITYGGVIVVVLLSKPLTNLRRIFIVYLVGMFIWSAAALIIMGELGNGKDWFKILVAAAVLVMLSLFYFVQNLFAQRRPWTPIVFWYGLVAICLTLFTDLVVETAYVESGHLVYIYNALIVFVAGPGYLLNVFSVVELVKGYRLTHDEHQRNRFRYLILSVSSILLISLINWTELGKYPIDIAVNGIAAITIAYAILRHQLLEIRVVIRTGLMYSIITGVTGGIYYLVITLTLSFYESYSGEQVFATSIVVAVITSLLISPLREITQQWIDRLFYRQKYDASLMMQRLSQATATLMDLEEITDIILDEIIATMKFQRAVFYIRNEGTNTYRLVSHQGNNDGYIPEIRADNPIVEWFESDRQILHTNELYVNPVFKSLWSDEKLAIETQNIELIVSLVAQKELLGFFMIGEKLSGQAISREDQRTLVTVANQTAIALKNARLFNELQETFVQTVVTLANAIDIRDTYTSDHSQRIATLGVETAKLMGCSSDDVQRIYWGSLLHDIGKIGIPDRILLKPGPLNEDEWDVIKQHPDIGANLIQPIKQLANISPIIKYSHERYDGTGYPEGLKGENIPLGARIVAVVDAFSAMMDRRVYKEANTLRQAIDELKRNAGGQFDPDVVAAFLKVLEKVSGSELLGPPLKKSSS